MARKDDEKKRQEEGEELLGAMFLNTIESENGVKNDAELARDLDVPPPVISKIRNNHRGVSADIMIRIHEAYGVSISRIKQLLRLDQVSKVEKQKKNGKK